jgi:hypothetical protein
MNIEQSLKIEQDRKNREKLLSLEKEGKYVFHGSPDFINILEPKQGLNLNNKTGLMEKDGKPAVFATQYADIAIFRSLVNSKDLKEDSRSNFGINDEKLNFSATKNLLDLAKTKIGKIYILDRQKFTNFEGSQCRCYESISPLEIVEVTYEDLPQNIEIIEPK